MLKERINNGVLEYYNRLYRNSWFLAKKKEKGTYRIINTTMEYNKHSIHDANLLLFVDEFSKEFASCKVALLIDFFSKYNQVELDIRCRDMTTFITLLGLLRQTTLPMGVTNSIA